MKYRIFIEIRGSIDSKDLWSKIAKYGINLMDAGTKSYVYGEVDFEAIGEIVSNCSLYGGIEATIER